MTRRFTDLNDPGWQALFTGVRSSWFRLETLQQYEVDYESQEYREFLRTGRLDREPGEWQHMISAHVRAGRTLQRVHVIEEPLSDYLRYEMAAYHHNGQAGEEIRLVPTSAGSWPDGLPQGRDFWIFDDAEVWEMQYDPSGKFLAAERLTSADAVAACRRWRDHALEMSMPLSEYSRTAA